VETAVATEHGGPVIGTGGRTLVSIVCPVYNEEASIEPFYERLMGVLQPLRGEYDFELLFMNNRSTDGTAARVLKLRGRDPAVQLLTLSRNFGYQNSVMAGLRQSSGGGDGGDRRGL
jgi:dolichol-phosphate mannosyltransferase